MKKIICYSTRAAIECIRKDDKFVERVCEFLGVEPVDDLSSVEFFNQSLDDALKDRQINSLESRLKDLKGTDK